MNKLKQPQELVDANTEAFKNAQNVVFQQFAKGRTLADLQGTALAQKKLKH